MKSYGKMDPTSTHLILSCVCNLPELGEVLDELLPLLLGVSGHQDTGGSPVQLVAAGAQRGEAAAPPPASRHPATPRRGKEATAGRAATSETSAAATSGTDAHSSSLFTEIVQPLLRGLCVLAVLLLREQLHLSVKKLFLNLQNTAYL